jgi:Na+-driven multidrug efflux pump
MMTSNQSSTRRRAWLYAGFTVFVWLIVFLFPGQVASLFGRNETTVEIGLKNYEEWVATILFALGIIVTAFAYWAPPRPEFIASFRRADPTIITQD